MIKSIRNKKGNEEEKKDEKILIQDEESIEDTIDTNESDTIELFDTKKQPNAAKSDSLDDLLSELDVPSIDNEPTEQIIKKDEPVPDPTSRPVDPAEGYLGKLYKIKTKRNAAVIELDELSDEKVLINFNKPQILLDCGMIGSGKSYDCANIIERILIQHRNMAIIVIDNVNIYWSLKFMNTNLKELQGWDDVKPRSFRDYVTIYVPEGDANKFNKNVYDKTISIKPKQIQMDTWLDLLDTAIDKTRGANFRTIMHQIIHEKGITDFGIEDIITTLDELESEGVDTGRAILHPATARSLRAMFEAMKEWGILSQETGLNIYDIVKPGHCTVIDVSESDESIAALLVAFIANAIYQARHKVVSEIMYREKGYEVDEQPYIPPVMLILEEAHMFLPRPGAGKDSNRTVFNLKSLQKFVKQGRNKGLSLLLVTQEPGELDIVPLKQLQGIFVHKLVHKNDIEAVKKICPFPFTAQHQALLRVLTPGQSLFIHSSYDEIKVGKFRPRMSLHVADTKNVSKDYEITSLPAPPPGLLVSNITEKDMADIKQLNRLREDNSRIKQQFEDLQIRFTEYKNKRFEDQILKLTIENEKLTNQLEIRNKELSILTADLKKVLPIEGNIKNGIIVGKFDTDTGYKVEYCKSSVQEDTNNRFKDLVSAGLGLGKLEGMFNIEDEELGKACGKRFSVPNIDGRGGADTYVLIFFSNTEEIQITEEILDTNIMLLKNEITDMTIINEAYESLFGTLEDSDKNIINNLQNEIKLKELDLQNKEREITEQINKIKNLEETIDNLQKQTTILQELNQKITSTKTSEDLTEFEKTKIILKEKDSVIESQTKTILEYNNKITELNSLINDYEEIKNLQAKKILKLEQETEKIYKELGKSRDINIEYDETILPPDTEPTSAPVKTAPIPEPEPQTQRQRLEELTKRIDEEIPEPGTVRDPIEIVKELQERSKVADFSKLYSNTVLEPIVKEKIIKKIKNLNEICFIILSIIEARVRNVSSEELDAIIGNVSKEYLQRQINKHMNNDKIKLIQKEKRGNTMYYHSNMQNFIRTTLRSAGVDPYTLSDNDIVNVYMQVRKVLDLNIAN